MPRKIIRRKVNIAKSPLEKFRNEMRALRERLVRYDNTAYDELADMVKLPGAKREYVHALVEKLMLRVTCEVHTLQMNDPYNRGYRVQMQYEDREAEPLYGWMYPKVHSGFISQSFVQAVIIAYVDLCHNLGRIIHANQGKKKPAAANGSSRVQGRKKLRRKVRAPSGSKA